MDEATNPIPITDAHDARLRDYRALTDLELRTKFEPPAGLFIAEGELAIRRALRSGYAMRSLLLATKRVEAFASLAENAPCYTATPDVLEETTGYHVHRGVLASFHRRNLPEANELLASSQRIVLLEGINNHTNIGAIFRVAAGLGFDALMLSPDCADPLYRRSVRVSMGEVFALPYAYLDPWIEGLAQVRAHGYTLLGLSPTKNALSLAEVGSAHRQRPALLFGAEGPGLSESALEACEATVAIPMFANVDSLNVAAATAVACWELTQPARS
ncbi:TrmH family RNA methyltransferase [Natronoglycomyces albus]|uniref:RNA methyltransferase n=1 Tax=Natronoglycomyces albus TaxID=2811108 RepID=A0A895XTN0_9ACTN|nr:RNA methyltransferase [Natronoglycomyces albus]QSB06659.1 RNA methyltransferase [Natronoglycomyces albus]